ncbi:unnamed protein product, partial [marine sediment metagenome]
LNFPHRKIYESANEMEEGVGDKFLQNRGVMPDKEQEFNRGYDIKQREEIVGDLTKIRTEPNYIVKNPKNIKSFDCEVRGIIDIDGNIYVHTKHYEDYTTHENMLDVLYDLNIFKKEHNWHQSPPKTFLTVQREKCTNNFLIGESNLPYGKSGEYWTADAKNDEAYYQFLDNAARV